MVEVVSPSPSPMVAEWVAGDGGTGGRSEITVTRRGGVGVCDRGASWEFRVRTSGGVVSRAIAGAGASGKRR